MHRLSEQFLAPSNFQRGWEKVAGNQGCAGVDGETIGHFAQRAETYLADLIKAIRAGTYRPLPLRQLLVPKQQGGWRRLGVPTVRDRIVQQALLNVLYPILEPQFEACSFAYRPGRSHQMAVQQVAHWRDRGYEWVLDADIVQYFDQVLPSRLLAEVAERLDAPEILELIRRWISVGLLTQEGLVLPEKGIPQGSVISPILANVYLDDFDELVIASGLKLVRFADDFVVMARSQGRILQAKEEVAQLLGGMGLQLHPEKTQITNFKRGFRFLGQVFAGDLVVPAKGPAAKINPPVVEEPSLRLIHAETSSRPTQMQQAMVEALLATHKPIPPPLFVFFGYAVRRQEPVPIESDEQVWRTGMSTLYLVQQGATLRREQGRFIVQPLKESPVEIPIQEVERILVFGNVQVTTAAIAACLEEHIPVVFLSQLGEYRGHLWSAEFCDLQAEAAQFQVQGDLAWRLTVAREIVRGKLLNSKQLLLRLNRRRSFPEVYEAITGISRDLEAVACLDSVTTLEALRGYEGTAAARYFPALGRLITNPGFTLTERSRRPPKDPVNSLLSFGYTLLFNNVLSLLLAEGLNPYLGNLHGSERKEAFLAFDLMEEFRSPVVDTLVMSLVNQKILRPTDFDWPTEAGGVYLTEAGRRVFLKHFEERISLHVSHADVQEQVSYRRAIQLQMQRYKRTLLEGTPYEAFRRVD